jgi:hypothetical protein
MLINKGMNRTEKCSFLYFLGKQISNYRLYSIQCDNNSERRIWKNAGGKGRGLFYGSILELAWSARGQTSTADL